MACQRCGELPDRCECPRYRHRPGTVNQCMCGALQGHHLIDFNSGDALICPGPVRDA